MGLEGLKRDVEGGNKANVTGRERGVKCKKGGKENWKVRWKEGWIV